MSVLILIALVAAWLVCIRLISSGVKALGGRKSVASYRIKYIDRTLQILVTIIFVTAGGLALGLKSTQVTVFLSSMFAVIGVAFFAQWSILSNITGSLIIFFAFPYRVGDSVRVVDKDDNISGVIETISLFHVIIKREDDLITYPNSLILQKAVIKIKSKENSISSDVTNNVQNDGNTD